MRKNLLLTCLLTLVAVLGMAQVKTTFPITLTEAEGLPGPFVVQNYLFKSEVYQLDAPVQKIRMTVCNTNTANNVGRGSHDGLSAYSGPGQPFFTMSEVRIFDEEGKQVEYAAYANSVDPGDGGGLAALSDQNEGTYLHTNYGERCLEMPYDYHYVEFELEKEVSTFSFSIQTRSQYYKNLITYMGVTAGSLDATEEELAYVPYPEQEFKLGEKVASVGEFAQPGALFVMRGSGQPYTRTVTYWTSGGEYEREDVIPGDLFMRSPYEAAITPTAANVFYLIPDADGTPDTYRVCWVNSGRYIASHTGGLDIWATWTRDIAEAAALTIIPCDTASGYYFTTPGTADVMNEETGEREEHKFTAYLGYDGYGRMDYIADSDSAFENTARPHSYNWTVYNASINGAAITAQLQTEIDEAKARLEAVGGKVEDYDEGEYDALIAELAIAEGLIAKSDVTPGEIVLEKRKLANITAAYAVVGLWAYADTITAIEEMAEAGEIKIQDEDAEGWTAGAYFQASLDELSSYFDVVEVVADNCESLSDVDNTIKNLYKAVDKFWASGIPAEMKISELPFRLGRPEDGLPGTNTNSIFSWKSPTYYFNEEIDAIRMTVFATKSGRNLNGKPFVCLTELEFFDAAGVEIPMTEDCFFSTSVANEGGGLAGLCDGLITTGTHFHSQWGADADYDGSQYFFLDIMFPEPVKAFSFAQHGRGNGYDDVPTDFAIGYYEETLTPDGVDFPITKDAYGAELGEIVTSVEDITDDGLYAIVGNWDNGSNGNHSSPSKFYSGLNAFAPVNAGVAAACAYRITKAENDSTYNIFSLAANKYLMNNGEGGNYYTAGASDKADAANVKFVPAAPYYEKAGVEGIKNAFFIYQYKDSIYKEVTTNIMDEETGTERLPHPYLFLNDWGNASSGRFVWRATQGFSEIVETTNADGVAQYFQGELEWTIYKMTMDRPNLYWLQSAYAEAAAHEMIVGTDPGYYTEGSVGEFAAALAQAQRALESNDEAQAAAAIEALNATKHLPEIAEKNPITAGVYIIETAEEAFLNNQGVSKVLCSYFNRNQIWNNIGLSASSELTLWWGNAPEDYFDCHDRYKFELVPAVITEDAPEGSIYSEALAIWLEDSVITVEQLENAYFIKSVETGQYVSVSEIMDANGQPRTSSDIGFSDEPLYPYIFRLNVAYNYDIWCPVGVDEHCFHMLNHSNGNGIGGVICHWNGAPNTPSLWKLRKIEEINDSTIYTLDISGEHGTYSGEGEYLSGTKVLLSAKADTGYVFKGWYKDGKLLSTKENYEFRVGANTSLVAKFEPATFKVTYSNAVNGTVSLSASTVAYGDSVNIELFPNKNCVISYLAVNGREVTDEIVDGRYTIYNVTSDINISVVFASTISNSTLDVSALRSSPGATLVIPVEMNNGTEITAFQLDIVLPNGITVETNGDGEYMIELASDRKTSSHTIASSRLSDGSIRVVAYSNTNKPFRGNSGTLLNITTKVSSLLAFGDYNFTMKDIRLTDANEVEYVTPIKTSTINVSVIPGDANMDDQVSISDVVTVVNYILEKPTKKFNFIAANVTNDDKVSIADVVGIVNLILNPAVESSNGYNAKRGVVASNGDRMSIDGVSAEGSNVSIPVSLDNATAYTGFQMDVELPEGATLASATLSSRAANSHSISWNTMADGKVRVVAYSLANATFAGNSGELITLNVEAAEGANGIVAVDNVRMATAEGVENAIGGCGSTIDINGTTGIGSINGNMFKIYTDNGAVVVESGKDMQLPVYSLNGRLIKILDATAGKNIFYLPNDTYVINGVKIVVK